MFVPTPVDTKQRRPRVRSEAHLAFIRKLSCAVCGKRFVEAAHLRAPSRKHGKRPTGKSEKPSDKWTLPLCNEHHREQHAGSELEFWTRHKIDPFVLALCLWAHSGDEDTAEAVLRAQRKDAT